MEATLVTAPGTKFVYSDINFITLGAIVEKISGEPWMYMREGISSGR